MSKVNYAIEITTIENGIILPEKYLNEIKALAKKKKYKIYQKFALPERGGGSSLNHLREYLFIVAPWSLDNLWGFYRYSTYLTMQKENNFFVETKKGNILIDKVINNNFEERREQNSLEKEFGVA